MGSSFRLLIKDIYLSQMKFFGILLSLGSFMVLNVAASGDENDWNYGGEEYWPTSHSKSAAAADPDSYSLPAAYYNCDGIKQSPININNSMVRTSTSTINLTWQIITTLTMANSQTTDTLCNST